MAMVAEVEGEEEDDVLLSDGHKPQSVEGRESLGGRTHRDAVQEERRSSE